LDILSGDLILLMPVRITQAKNIEKGIRLIQALKGRGVKPHLVVTGPPDPHDEKSMQYFQSLVTLRQELEVRPEVHFICEEPGGANQIFQIDMNVVGDFYRVADLLFMPSHREGFGMPVLEAALAGIPVFSTEIPAAREIGYPDVFLISPDEPPDEIAGRILDWADKSRIHRLRRRVRQQNTWQSIFQQKIEPVIKLAMDR
jgi:glycosyltransferase involved in cell wall biosynthesis